MATKTIPRPLQLRLVRKDARVKAEATLTRHLTRKEIKAEWQRMGRRIIVPSTSGRVWPQWVHPFVIAICASCLFHSSEPAIGPSMASRSKCLAQNSKPTDHWRTIIKPWAARRLSHSNDKALRSTIGTL
jgi:hypothetical protein